MLTITHVVSFDLHNLHFCSFSHRFSEERLEIVAPFENQKMKAESVTNKKASPPPNAPKNKDKRYDRLLTNAVFVLG